MKVSLMTLKWGTELKSPLGNIKAVSKKTHLDQLVISGIGVMAIEGSLNSVDIQDVVQLLNINGSTGRLRIQNTSIQGSVYFSEGEVVEAEVEGLRGDNAAFVLLGQADGTFRFQPELHNQPRTINRTIHDLVLEAARRKDTIQNIRTRISHNNIIFLPLVDVRIPEIAGRYSDIEKNLLSLLDGQADIQAIIKQVNKGEFETLYTLYELEQKGDLKRVNVFKLLEVHNRKSLFGAPKDVLISEKIMKDWENESAVYSGSQIIEIRTQQMIYGQIRFQAKPQIPDGQILMSKPIMDQFQVKEMNKVLIKPIPTTY